MPATFSAFDSTPVSIMMKALAESFNLDEKERRESAEKNKDFYYGKQEAEVILMNDDVLPVILNLTKPIIGKRTSMLYSRPLVREWDGPSQSEKYLELVYKENHIDSLLRNVDLLSELTGSCLVHPTIDERMESGLKLVLYDATQFSVVGNDGDSSTADAISLIKIVDRIMDSAPTAGGRAMPQVEKVILQQVWTNTSVQVFQGSHAAATEVENTLGFLPFVNFQGEEVHDQYIGFPQATIIRKLNREINQMLTHIGYMVKMQAGTPIVFSGFKSGESVVVHPGRAINIPTDATASVLDLNPKLEETLKVVEFLEDRLYTTSSVPKISVEGGEGESGRELMVRWFPLMQVFQEKTNRFNRYELNLANMILTIAGLPPMEDVNIKWPEESLLPLSAEEENLERDITLSIKSPVDEIMRRNPHMTEEEATAEWMKNLAENSSKTEEPEDAVDSEV
jgi:hypothetical protein